MEEQFQKYLSRKRELLSDSPRIDSSADALSTNPGELDTCDRTDEKRFNPTPPPVLIGQTSCQKRNEAVLSEDEIVLTKINLSKIPNTQLEKETAKLKMKYHIRRLRIARRIIINQSIHAHAKLSSTSFLVDSKPLR